MHACVNRGLLSCRASVSAACVHSAESARTTGYHTHTNGLLSAQVHCCRWEHTWFGVVVSHAGVDIGDEAEEAAGTDPLALTCDEVVPWKTLSAQQRERWWPEALAVLERLETAHGLLRFDSNPGNFALRLRRGRSGVPVQSDVGAEGAGGGEIHCTSI